MSAAVQWLAPHMSDAPDTLRERMLSALADVDATQPVPRQLSDAAMSCLRASLENPAERSCALDLLAADALLTHACQAAAEAGNESLLEFTKTLNADSFAALLRDK